MPGGVVAWIVAVEGYLGEAGRASSLDFDAPIAARAFEWVEWLKDTHPEATLLLNVSLRHEAPADELARLQQSSVTAANRATGLDAGPEALHRSLQSVQDGAHDMLILIWIGHGVMIEGDRYLVHQGSRRADALRCWHVPSLLRSLRRATAPAVQIGLFDTCANQGVTSPVPSTLAARGNVPRSQHFIFSAVAAAQTALSAEHPTGASVALEVTKALPWPPTPEHFAEQFDVLKGARGLAPIAFARTRGSGDLWDEGGHVSLERADLDELSRREQVDANLLAHLWDARSSLPVSPRDLAVALRTETLDELVSVWRPQRAAGVDLLEAAVRRVRRVQHWRPFMEDLQLGAGQWLSLAHLVATAYGRDAPAPSGIVALMLWTLEIHHVVGDPRDQEQLLHLLLLGIERATPSAPRMTTRLGEAIAADPVFAPQCADLATRARLPRTPITVLVELDLPDVRGEPAITDWWVMVDDHFEPREDVPLTGTFSRQLTQLMARVAARNVGRELRLELLAPAELLVANRDCLNGGPVALDRRYPVVWRSRDRLSNDLDWDKPSWARHAPTVRARAIAQAGLLCRFADEPPHPPPDPHVVLGMAVIPGPGETGPGREAFLGEVMVGHPYMVWPCRSPDDAPTFKQTVQSWFAQRQLDQLPERYLDARKAGYLPSLVLFIDEPGRDPYDQFLPPEANAR